MNEEELFYEDDFESIVASEANLEQDFGEHDVKHSVLEQQPTPQLDRLSLQGQETGFIWYASSALSNRSKKNEMIDSQYDRLQQSPQIKSINPVNLFKINSRQEFLDLVVQVARRDVKACLAGVNVTHPDIFYTTKQLLEEKREEFFQKQKDKALLQNHQKQLKVFAQKQQQQLQQMELEARHRDLELKQRELEQKQREWEERLKATVVASSKKDVIPVLQEEKSTIIHRSEETKEATPSAQKSTTLFKQEETKKLQRPKTPAQPVLQKTRPQQLPSPKNISKQVHFSDSQVEEFYNATINENTKQEENTTLQQDVQIAFYKPKAKKTSTKRISNLEKKLRLQEDLQKKLKARLENLQTNAITPVSETLSAQSALQKKENVSIQNQSKTELFETSVTSQLLPEDRELLDLTKLLNGVGKDIKIDNMLNMLERYESKDKEIEQRYLSKNFYRVSMSYSDSSSSTASVNSSLAFETTNDFPLVYDDEVRQQIYGYKDAYQKFLDQTDYAILRKSSDLPPNAVSDLLCEYIMEEVLMECAKEIQSIGNATVQAIFDAEFTIRNSLTLSKSIPEEVFEAAKAAQ